MFLKKKHTDTLNPQLDFTRTDFFQHIYLILIKFEHSTKPNPHEWILQWRLLIGNDSNYFSPACLSLTLYHQYNTDRSCCLLSFSSLARAFICCTSMVSGFLRLMYSSWLPIHNARIRLFILRRGA